MKKTFIILAATVIIILIGWYFANEKTPSQPALETMPLSQPASDMMPTPPTEASSGAINSIKDAMGLGKKMACTYSGIGDSQISSTVFIDGQKIKTMTTVQEEIMYGIFDGDTQYTWTTGANRQGFKMDIACMNQMKELAPKAPESAVPAPPVQDYQALEAIQNVSCQPADNEDFSIPSDITFIDQCEMLRNSMESLNPMKQPFPSSEIPAQY